MDACLQLGPARMGCSAAPAVDIGTLDLVERHRRQSAVDTGLDEFAGIARKISLGAHPLRLDRGRRPQHDNSLGFFEVALDDFGIRAVGRKVGVPPDDEAGGLEHSRDATCDRMIFACIADEYVGHARPPNNVRESIAQAAESGLATLRLLWIR